MANLRRWAGTALAIKLFFNSMNTSRDEIIKQYVFQFIQNRKAKRGFESHPIHITCKPKWLSMEPAHISAVQRQGEFTANLKKVLGVF